MRQVVTEPVEDWKHELGRTADNHIADYHPSPREPDPRVWPLESDAGYEEFDPKSDFLFLICNSVPSVHARWVTEQQLRSEINDVTAAAARESLPQSLRLTPDRRTAFTRIATLFNGDLAGPDDVHLILDRPGWTDLLDDLDGLDELTADGKDPVEAAFGGYDWYPAVGVFLKTQYLARSPSRLAPTQRAKVLINEHDDFPALHGDPFEGLKHRFGVGLLVALGLQAPGTWDTYVRINGRVVDFVYYPPENDRPRQLYEVVTDHNNTTLYRSTYRKTRELDGVPNYLFDSRTTAYRVFNHWAKRGLADFGIDEFSSQEIAAGRELTTTAYQRPGVQNTGVFDWLTMTQAWQTLVGTGEADSDSYPGSLFNQYSDHPSRAEFAAAIW